MIDLTDRQFLPDKKTGQKISGGGKRYAVGKQAEGAPCQTWN